jgi:hypothetical protein
LIIFARRDGGGEQSTKELLIETLALKGVVPLLLPWKLGSLEY